MYDFVSPVSHGEVLTIKNKLCPIFISVVLYFLKMQVGGHPTPYLVSLQGRGIFLLHVRMLSGDRN